MKKINIVAMLICTLFALMMNQNANANPAPAPKLVFNSDGTERAIKLTKLNIYVKIMGNIAQTTMDMSFYPDSASIPRRLIGREFEGNLIFPLANGQTISQLSMEIDGIMRRGVVVEKERARVIFEDLERRKIDPALLEKTTANAYKLRIYPIRISQAKRIIVQYEEVLQSDEVQQRYVLPLSYDYAIDSVSFFADVYSTAPVKLGVDNTMKGVEFEQEGECYSTANVFTAYQPNEIFSITIPAQEESEHVLIEKGKESFFMANMNIDIPKAKPLKYKSIALYWDCSHSAQFRKLESDMSLLSTLLSNNDNTEVTIYTFNYKIKSERTFRVMKNDVSEIKEYLRNVKYDGGTNFDCINIPAGKYDIATLFSDGISSFAHSKTIASPIPVYTISSQVMTNERYLEDVAQTTGGIYLNALNIDDDLKMMIKNQLYRLISIEYLDGTMEDVYPKSTTNLRSGFSIVGKLTSQNATLKLNFGFGNVIDKSKEIEISGDELDTKILERIWARKKIDELAVDRKNNRAAIVDIAKKYSIVTEETSLLVLESANDYIRYNVEPPKEEKDIYEEYQLVANNKIDIPGEDEGKYDLESLINQFEERKKWYSRDFIAMSKKIEELRKKLEKQKHKDIDQLLDGEKFDSEEEKEAIMEALFGGRGDGGVIGTAWNRSPMMMAAADANVESVMETSIRDSHREARSMMKSAEGRAPEAPQQEAKVTLSQYDSNAPYFVEFKEGKQDFETLYDKHKARYGNTIGFYIDISEILSAQKNYERAAEVITNISELSQDNQEFLRIVAYKLQYLGQIDLAIQLFEFIKDIRGEEPQSYRDLALAFEEKGEYQKACDLLYEMALKRWDGRFHGLNLTAIIEMNAIIAKHTDKVNTDKYDSKLIAPMPLDMRVVLRWDLDNTDIDLWVTDPKSEKCFYGYRNTTSGGMLPQDLTGGYGPEEFLQRQAVEGKYVLECNYYGSRSVQMAGGATIFLDLYTNYCKPNEKKETIVMRLRGERETVKIGEYEFKLNKGK